MRCNLDLLIKTAAEERQYFVVFLCATLRHNATRHNKVVSGRISLFLLKVWDYVRRMEKNDYLCKIVKLSIYYNYYTLC